MLTKASDTQYFLKIGDDPLPQFIITVTDKSYNFSGHVLKVISWNEAEEPVGQEPYLCFFIKWDGCSHVWFGKPDEKDNRNGYLHLCGSDQWREHLCLMTELYELAAQVIDIEDDHKL